MSDADGRWACEVDTPMGRQGFTLVIAVAGDRFSGRAEGGMGAMDIPDGTVDGDAIAWSMRVAKPLPITLDCKATVAGNRLEGRVGAGILGSFPITGSRV